MENRQEKAAELFANSFNCAQAVVAACSERYGLSQELALKVAGGFGGGLRCGEVCGAACGAVMVIGLAHGQTVAGDMETKAECGRRTKQYMARFQQQYGALRCVDLLGVDNSTPEGQAAAKERNLYGTVCAKLVQSAVEILEELGY